MKIWVLGSKHPEIEKSILWHEGFEHFSNSDLLIVNLTTLNSGMIEDEYAKFYDTGRKYILDLLMTSEKQVIFIMNNDQNTINWLPVHPIIKETNPVDLKDSAVESYLEEYMKKVKNCSYYIHDFDIKYLDEKVDPKLKSHENYPFTSEILRKRGFLIYHGIQENIITNQAKQIIGGTFFWKIFVKYRVFVNSWDSTHIANTSHMVILPPPTSISVEKGIELIINTLVGKEIKESPPEWEKTISLPGLNQIENDTIQKEQEKKQIELDIENLKQKRNNLTVFRRLLWTKNFTLEDVVKNAFVFLGFPEIRKIRAENLEDWVFDFQTLPDFNYGVFEVKGSDKRTALADLTQCNKWVEDYMLEDIGKAKGIFVPNQHRLTDPTDPREREHFEPNEIEYASKREICILPAHEIFNAVIEKMKKNPEITRTNIEQKIATSNGLCKLV